MEKWKLNKNNFAIWNIETQWNEMRRNDEKVNKEMEI